MKLIRGESGLAHFAGPCVATVGGFDALHMGHQAIIKRSTEAAAQRGLPCVIILFEPLPAEFFEPPGAVPARLYPFRERLDIVHGFGVDYVVCLRFSEGLAGLSAEAFIEKILIGSLNMQYLVVGDDFRFGSRRRGNADMLRRYGSECGFEVEQVDGVEADGERISSTRIRKLLAAGDVDGANRLLGRRYGVSGRVVRGDSLGAKLGYPTANLACDRLPPLRGVFAVEVERPGREVLQGVANAGFRPTVGGDKYCLETHIFDFDEDIHRERIRVRPMSKIRDEARFDSLDALKQAIAEDVAEAQRFFGRGALPRPLYDGISPSDWPS